MATASTSGAEPTLETAVRVAVQATYLGLDNSPVRVVRAALGRYVS
jgi:hypothetical protein